MNAHIPYGLEQYAALKDTYRKWWDGTLDRPIVPIVTVGHETKLSDPRTPLLHFTSAWDLSVTPQMMIDAHTYQFSQQRYHGDAFPIFLTQYFGAGVMAAFLGCKPIPAPNTIWFLPEKKDIPIESLHFEYDENNPYLRRVLNTIEAALVAWGDQVVIGMPDLGGILDVLASFRGSENLLLDLYDAPDEVLRCVKELQELWLFYFDKICAMLSPTVPGYSHWFGLYHEDPGYMLQSDFSYMIGPDMFNRFVAWELASTSAHLTNAVYHLDGVGEIVHLDQLLAIETIKGIQWVPGAGSASDANWDDLLARILASGKKLLSCNQNPDGTPIALAKNLGQLYFPTHTNDIYHLKDAAAYGALYGIEIC